MTIHLPKELETDIRAAVEQGHFPSVDAALTEAVRLLLQQLHPAKPAQPAANGAEQGQKPIWERVLERTAAIPDEEWNKLPTDLAEQHDHYIYGTPKRPPS